MDKPTYLEKIDPSELMYLYSLLEDARFPVLRGKSGRAEKFGVHEGMVMGIIKPRFSGKWKLSVSSEKFPELYDEIVRIGKLCVPFEFETIQLNHNVVCPPHLDSQNVGDSVLLSVGDYEGCNLHVDGVGEFDTNCHPLLFNGSKMLHWNTPLKSGNKYSLVYFNARKKSP